MTEQVSLIFGKWFRSILKKNTWKYDKMYVFVIEVSLIVNE